MRRGSGEKGVDRWWGGGRGGGGGGEEGGGGGGEGREGRRWRGGGGEGEEEVEKEKRRWRGSEVGEVVEKGAEEGKRCWKRRTRQMKTDKD